MNYPQAVVKPLTMERGHQKAVPYLTREEQWHNDFLAGVRAQYFWVMSAVVLCWGLALCAQWFSTGSLEGGIDGFSGDPGVFLHMLGVAALVPLLRLRFLGEPKSWAYRSNAYVAGRHLASVGYLIGMAFVAVLAEAPLMAIEMLVVGVALHFKPSQKTGSSKLDSKSNAESRKRTPWDWRAFAVSAAVLRVLLASALGLGVVLLVYGGVSDMTAVTAAGLQAAMLLSAVLTVMRSFVVRVELVHSNAPIRVYAIKLICNWLLVVALFSLSMVLGLYGSAVGSISLVLLLCGMLLMTLPDGSFSTSHFSS